LYGFALRGKWLVGHVTVLVLSGLFVLAGMWQLNRLDERRERNAVIADRRAMPAVPLEELLTAGAADRGLATDRRITVAGRYDSDRQFLVQFRSLGGRTGEYVLTPLVTEEGPAVIVNRGWVPVAGSETALPREAGAPAGRVSVGGLVLPSEAGTRAQPGDGVAILSRIDLPTIQEHVPYVIHPVYVQLQSQDPSQPAGIPMPIPSAEFGNGPHLSYAIQWFSFAVIGLIGWPLVIRRAARERVGRVTRPSGGRR
jgi:cytochrome oxidase assembly protein ShyY1